VLGMRTGLRPRRRQGAPVERSRRRRRSGRASNWSRMAEAVAPCSRWHREWRPRSRGEKGPDLKRETIAGVGGASRERRDGERVPVDASGISSES
jgi:hypothetical protein